MGSPRQPEAGKAFLLSTDTFGKLMKSLKKKPRPATFSNTDTNIISLINGSGDRVDAYNALSIDTSAIESTQDNYFSDHSFDGITPSFDDTRLAILLEPLEDGAVGQAAIGGVCVVEVDVTDISHTSAKSSGSQVLESGTTGPLRFLEPPTATGQQFLKCVFTPNAVPAITNGMVHGVSQEDFTDTSTQVDVQVTFSTLPDVNVGDIVTAINYIGYSGDLGGECFVYYHGDGTGNEDGTYSLMGARCPV